MADVFISYKREQRDDVERIASSLQKLGLSVWFDARLDGGSTFHTEINDEIRAAKAVLVCWTADAVKSQFVVSESQIGVENKTLVPVFLEYCQLPPPFNGIHTVDLTKWRGNETDPVWLSLIRVLSQKLSRPGLEHLAHAIAAGETFVPQGANEADSFSFGSKRGKKRSGAAKQKKKRTKEKFNLFEFIGRQFRNVLSLVAKTALVMAFGVIALLGMKRWILSAAYFPILAACVLQMFYGDSDFLWGGMDIGLQIQYYWGPVYLFANMFSAAGFAAISIVPKSIRRGVVDGFLGSSRNEKHNSAVDGYADEDYYQSPAATPER